MMKLFTKGVAEDDLETIYEQECAANVDSLTRARFRKLWNEYERLRVRVKDSATFGVAFDTLKYPGLVHVVQVTMSQDVMQDSDVVSVDLASHPHYKSLQQYVKANPR